MIDFLRAINDIFDSRMKWSALLALVISTFLALLDTLAISLILPLVELLSGSGSESDLVMRLERAIGSQETENLVAVLSFDVVTLFILKDVGSTVYSWWFAGFKSLERVKLQTLLLENFLKTPYAVISRRNSSDLLRVLNESVTQVFGSAVYGLMNMATNTVSIIAIMLALAVAAPLPTLAVVVYLGVSASIYFLVVKPIAGRAGLASARAARDGYATSLAAIGGLKDLNLRDTQSFFVGRYCEAVRRSAFAGRTAEFIGGLPRYLLEILFIVGIGLFFSFVNGQSSGSTVGLLSLFVAGGFRVLPAINGLLGNLAQFRFGRPYLDIVHREVLAAKQSARRQEMPGPRLDFNDSVEIRRLSFRYPGGDRYVLSDVSLEIPHRTSFALVGCSGSGKTTLADLILGLQDPTAGEILVDGVDISGHKRRWQQNVGYVAQDIFLLDATLAENIALDQRREDIDEERLARAISRAQLAEMVNELPQGVDTALGERGTRLSGGERQRVGIARSLYRQPRLLVLDEATAALDNETEHRINETIATLQDEMTVIIIAHRLSTIRHCDQVAFLKDGHIDAVGSFDELVREHASFARLARLGGLGQPDGGLR